MHATEADRARRLERVEVRCAYEWTEACARAQPGAGFAAWPVGEGAVAAWLGAESPMSRVIGLGLDGPVSDDDLDRLESAFRERGTALRVEFCPLAGGKLASRLTWRGYRVSGFEDMIVRPVASADADLGARADARLGSDVRIEEVGGEAREIWSRIAVEGFFDDDGPPGFAAQIAAAFDLPDTACFLARVAGEPAACAAVTWRDGVAALYGMATLPRFRRRGIQGAMVAHRVARGARAGCELASVGATPGGDSHRNLERLGFVTAYTRTNFTLPEPRPARAGRDDEGTRAGT